MEIGSSCAEVLTNQQMFNASLEVVLVTRFRLLTDPVRCKNTRQESREGLRQWIIQTRVYWYQLYWYKGGHKSETNELLVLCFWPTTEEYT